MFSYIKNHKALCGMILSGILIILFSYKLSSGLQPECNEGFFCHKIYRDDMRPDSMIFREKRYFWYFIPHIMHHSWKVEWEDKKISSSKNILVVENKSRQPIFIDLSSNVYTLASPKHLIGLAPLATKKIAIEGTSLCGVWRKQYEHESLQNIRLIVPLSSDMNVLDVDVRDNHLVIHQK